MGVEGGGGAFHTRWTPGGTKLAFIDRGMKNIFLKKTERLQAAEVMPRGHGVSVHTGRRRGGLGVGG